MLKQPPSRPVHLAVLAAASLGLAACGSAAEPAADDPTAADERRSTPSAQQRLVVASDAGVAVVDADSLKTVDTFSTESRAKLAVAGDDRHVFTMQYDAGTVGVVDGGAWSEPHGDHSHHYVTKPSQRDTSFDRGTSYHVVSDDERSVVWFDDDASFVSFDWKGLADDEVDETVVETGSAHHGVAAPLPDGGWLASTAEGEDAVGVKVLDEDGKTTRTIEDCTGLHGETHVDDGYAFGCSDGVLVVRDGRGSTIESPVEGAGTGALYPADGDSSVVVGDLRTEDDDPEAAPQVALYDVSKGSARAVDLGVEYSSVAVYQDEAFALGTDGDLHVIDLATGKVTRTMQVTDDWETDEDWEVPVPQVVQAGGVAYVTDPRDDSITSFDLTSGDERATGTLDETPASLVVTNAGR